MNTFTVTRTWPQCTKMFEFNEEGPEDEHYNMYLYISHSEDREVIYELDYEIA